MSFIKLLNKGKFFEIQKRTKRFDSLEKESTPYCGALRPHSNPNMILLLTSPLESRSEVFEFRTEDIAYAEELSSLSKPNGVTVEQIRLWIKNGSPAMKMEPVRVGNDS